MLGREGVEGRWRMRERTGSDEVAVTYDGTSNNMQLASP
jgi:hypothetical protein